jgi:hypothetical protein
MNAVVVKTSSMTIHTHAHTYKIGVYMAGIIIIVVLAGRKQSRNTTFGRKTALPFGDSDCRISLILRTLLRFAENRKSRRRYRIACSCILYTNNYNTSVDT